VRWISRLPGSTENVLSSESIAHAQGVNAVFFHVSHVAWSACFVCWARVAVIHHLFAQTRRRTHDQHENNSITRKAQKTGAYILPIKKKKNKHTRYKNNYYYNYYNYDYAYRKNAEKSTRLSDRLHLDNDEKSTA